MSYDFSGRLIGVPAKPASLTSSESRFRPQARRDGGIPRPRSSSVSSRADHHRRGARALSRSAQPLPHRADDAVRLAQRDADRGRLEDRRREQQRGVSRADRPSRAAAHLRQNLQLREPGTASAAAAGALRERRRIEAGASGITSDCCRRSIICPKSGSAPGSTTGHNLPNLAFDIYPDQIDYFQIIPVAPGRCYARSRAYALDDNRREMRAARWLNQRINLQVGKEDVGLVEGTQAGLASPAMAPGIFPARRRVSSCSRTRSGRAFQALAVRSAGRFPGASRARTRLGHGMTRDSNAAGEGLAMPSCSSRCASARSPRPTASTRPRMPPALAGSARRPRGPARRQGRRRLGRGLHRILLDPSELGRQPLCLPDAVGRRRHRPLALTADAIHAHGALAGIELWHGGAACLEPDDRVPGIAPDRCSRRMYHLPTTARAMDMADIRAFRGWQREAAMRAKRAGFDIVYVYAGHDYLPFQFLSRRTNHARRRLWRQPGEPGRGCCAR